jgi:hypothetical protein
MPATSLEPPGGTVSEPILTIRVECYAGHRSDERPTRFFIGSRKVDVADVLDRWLAPDHRYFKVKGDDGDVYIIRHDVKEDRWELTVFERGTRRS